jgi:hypothetical protein
VPNKAAERRAKTTKYSAAYMEFIFFVLLSVLEFLCRDGDISYDE